MRFSSGSKVIFLLVFLLKLVSSQEEEIVTEIECLNIDNAAACNAKEPCGCKWSTGLNKCTCGDAEPLDIVFALDSSKSLGETAFDVEVDWTAQFIETSLPDDVRVGIVVFANEAEIHMHFKPPGTYPNNYAIASDVKQAATWLVTQYTDIPDAIDKMYEVLNETPLADRNRMFVMLTDGRPHRSEDPNGAPMSNATFCAMPQATTLRGDSSIDTYIVGLGDDWAPSFAKCMVSKTSNILQVKKTGVANDKNTYDVSGINDAVLDLFTQGSCQCDETLAPTNQPTNAPTDKPTSVDNNTPTATPAESPSAPSNLPTTSTPTDGEATPTTASTPVETPVATPTTEAPATVSQPNQVPTIDSSYWHTVNPNNSGTLSSCLEECNFKPCMCFENASCCDCDKKYGCNKCKDGYFQMSRNHRCLSCETVFGTECLKCTDEIGCVQCQMGYKLKHDEKCDLWHCQSEFECPMTENHMTWYKHEI